MPYLAPPKTDTGIARLLDVSDPRKFAPVSRGVSVRHLNLSSSLADFDEALIEAQLYKPIWSWWAIVSQRPLPENFLGFVAPACQRDETVILGDDCAVMVKGGATALLATFTTIGTEDAPRFLINVHLHRIDGRTLSCAFALIEMAFSHGLISFPDADILNALAKIHKTPQAIRRAYLASPDRSRPIFIMRRAASTSTSNSTQAITQFSRVSLQCIGLVLRDTELHSSFRSLANFKSLNPVAVMPDGKPLVLSYVSTDEFWSPEFAEALQELPAAIVSGLEEVEIVSNTALLAFKSDIISRSQYATYAKVGAEFRSWWDEEMAKLALKQATSTPVSTDQPAPDLTKTPALKEPERAASQVAPLRLDPEGYPVACETIPDWIAERHAANVVILPRARRALAKSRHPEPARLARALELLATQRHGIFNGNRSLVPAYEEALLKLRLRDTFTNAERLSGQTGDAYVCQFEGRRLLLDRHLASTVSGWNDPRLIRIYFATDRTSGKIVVGWLPGHLPTKRS